MNEIAKQLRNIAIELRLQNEMMAWQYATDDEDAFEELDKRRDQIKEITR